MMSSRFWRGMYNRFDSGLHPKENVGDIITAAKDHSTSLEDHILLLEKVEIKVVVLLFLIPGKLFSL